MRDLCADICSRTEPLQHVDMQRVAVGFVQARNRSSYGTFATLTPMRFAGGSLTAQRRGQLYTVQRIFSSSGQEMLYLLNFYLPRFLQLEFEERLVTVFHELWHVSPRFDGDIRRFQGRCYAHSGSQKRYDALMHALVRQWLERGTSPERYGFLRLSFDQLVRHHGPIYGLKYRHPKLIPVRHS
jgi:predicted metallopeptidase